VRPLLLFLIASGFVARCGSGESVVGDPDSGLDQADTPVGEDVADQGESACVEDRDCDDLDPCTTDRCIVDEGLCWHDSVDDDGDGYTAAVVEGTECGGSDCDDSRADVHPGAPTVCGDGVDQNCDGHVGGAAPLLEDVRLSDCACYSGSGHIAWSGSEFGVVWADGDYRLLFRSVKPDGGMSGGPITLEVREPVGHIHPSIVWAGSGYGVAWDTSTGAYANDIFFMRLAVDGTPGDVLQVTHTGGGDHTMCPALAWTGSEFGMTYESWWSEWFESALEIWFTRLSASGTSMMDDLVLMETPEWSEYPSITWTGSEFGLAWKDDREALYDQDIFFTRVSAEGREIIDDLKVADGCTLPVACSPDPDVVWTGSEYAIAWSSNQRDTYKEEVHLARVSASGLSVIEDEIITDGHPGSYIPSLAWSGSSFGLVWEERAFDESDLYFVMLTPEGDPIGDVARITDSPDYSGRPVLTWGSGMFGVVWDDWRGSYGDVYFNVIVLCD
jgi:hypothetical protein